MLVPQYLDAGPLWHTYRAVGEAGVMVDPYQPPDTPSDRTGDSTGCLGVVETSLVVIAPEVVGVKSGEAAVVGGEAVVGVTRDDTGRVGDEKGGVPCHKAWESPDHLQTYATHSNIDSDAV